MVPVLNFAKFLLYIRPIYSRVYKASLNVQCKQMIFGVYICCYLMLDISKSWLLILQEIAPFKNHRIVWVGRDL